MTSLDAARSDLGSIAPGLLFRWIGDQAGSYARPPKERASGARARISGTPNVNILRRGVAQFAEIWHTSSTIMQLRGRPCSVCGDPRAREIATALLAGGSCRDVGRRYRIPASTLARHQRLHLRARIARAEAAIGRLAQVPCERGSLDAEIVAAPRLHRVESYEEAFDVQQSVRDLYGRTLALLDRAEGSGDLSGALRAVREARSNLELLGRLDGSLSTAAPVLQKIEVVYAEKQLLPGAAHLLDGGN